MDQFVLDTFCKFFFSDGLAEILTNQINKTMKELLRNGNEEVVMARKALRGLKIVQKNLVEAIANAGYNHSFVDKLNATEKQIAEYESMIEAEDAKHIQRSVRVEEVKEQISKLRTYFEDPKNIDETRYILRHYIHKVIIGNDSVKVIFKIALTAEANGHDVEIAYNYSISEDRNTVESIIPDIR